MALKETLKQKIEEFRPRTTRLVKEFGNVIIDQVTIGQAIGGARDVRSLVTDISYLDPQEGIRFRGKTIPETFAALPKAAGLRAADRRGLLLLPAHRRHPDPGPGRRGRCRVEGPRGGTPVRLRRAPRRAARHAIR